MDQCWPNCWIKVVQHWPTLRKVRLDASLQKKTFVNQDPKAVSCWESVQLRVKLYRCLFACCSLIKPSIYQMFQQTANGRPTVCPTWPTKPYLALFLSRHKTRISLYILGDHFLQRVIFVLFHRGIRWLSREVTV